MAITIYSAGGVTLKYTLKSILASRLHQSLNGECTFDFSMPGRLIPNIAIGDEVHLGDLYFSVCRIAKNTQIAGAMFAVSCEHVSYDLADQEQEAAHFSGTPANVLSTILSGTGFTVGTVTVSGDWSITINETTSKRDALQQWAAACGAELSYYRNQINFVARVGSAIPAALKEKENVKSLSVTLDSRSETQTYAVELSRLQHLGLGDAITIQYTSLNLTVSTRIISLDYDPFHPMAVSMTTGDYVPNFTGVVSAALEARLKEGQPYFGVTIDKENGLQIKRSDGLSEAVFNSDVFAMRALVDDVMTDRIYFDPVKRNYVFDGILGADAVFTDSLYAEQGDIAELTVDRLSTSKKVRLYILSNTQDDNFVHIQDNYIHLTTGSVKYDPESPTTPLTEQATNRYGQDLYWQREPVGHNASGYPTDANGVQIYATTEETDWPVMVYQYDEQIKAAFAFESDGTNYVPTLSLGAGDEHGNSRGFIYKDATSLLIQYINSLGNDVSITFGDDGYVEIKKLRRAIVMNFASFNAGFFYEILDGNVLSQYQVDFDGSGRPIKIYDTDHECQVVW